MPCHWRTISRTCLRWCRQKGSILWLCGFLSPYTVGRCFRKKKAMKFISALPSVAQTLEPPATFYSCKKYYFAPCLQSRQSWSFADWKKGRCSVYIWCCVYIYICISSSNLNTGYSLRGVLVESLKTRFQNTIYLRSFVEWPAEVVSEALPPWSFLQHLKDNPWKPEPTVYVCEFLDDLGFLGRPFFWNAPGVCCGSLWFPVCTWHCLRQLWS